MPNYICRSALAMVRLFILNLAVCAALSLTAYAQENAAAPQTPAVTGSMVREQPGVDYEVQLYMLVASQNVTTYGSVPAVLRPLVGQLRNSLGFENYGVALTTLNRLRSNQGLSANGATRGLPAPTTANGIAPTLFTYTIDRARAATDEAGQSIVQLERFVMNLRAPLAGFGTGSIDYQNVGFTTSVSLRENTPTVIGTLTTSRPDEILVLAAQVRRVPSR